MKKIIVKIGTNILTTPSGKLDLNNLRELVYQIADLLDEKKCDIILVSSGAITCGAEKLGFQPTTIPEKQAAASVGQILLLDEYGLFFGKRGYQIGQILLTKNGLKEKVKQRNILNTIHTLLKQNVIPIINENDSIATDEIEVKFGDNDELSAHVAKLIKADMLIILTDMDGVFSDNPLVNKNAKVIHKIDKVTESTLKLASIKTPSKGKGGMKSKLLASKEASEFGIDVIIANGRQKHVLDDIFSKSTPGTLIKAQKSKKK